MSILVSIVVSLWLDLLEFRLAMHSWLQKYFFNPHKLHKVQILLLIILT